MGHLTLKKNLFLSHQMKYTSAVNLSLCHEYDFMPSRKIKKDKKKDFFCPDILQGKH